MWPCLRPFAQVSPESCPCAQAVQGGSPSPVGPIPMPPGLPLTVYRPLLAEELHQLAKVGQVGDHILLPPGPDVRGLQWQHLGDIKPLQEMAELPVQAGIPPEDRAAFGDVGLLQHGEGERGCERHWTSPAAPPSP